MNSIVEIDRRVRIVQVAGNLWQAFYVLDGQIRNSTACQFSQAIANGRVIADELTARLATK